MIFSHPGCNATKPHRNPTMSHWDFNIITGLWKLFSKPNHQDLAIPGLPERILISDFPILPPSLFFHFVHRLQRQYNQAYDYSMGLDNQGLQGLWGAKHGERVKPRLDMVSYYPFSLPSLVIKHHYILAGPMVTQLKATVFLAASGDHKTRF